MESGLARMWVKLVVGCVEDAWVSVGWNRAGRMRGGQ